MPVDPKTASLRRIIMNTALDRRNEAEFSLRNDDLAYAWDKVAASASRGDFDPPAPIDVDDEGEDPVITPEEAKVLDDRMEHYRRINTRLSEPSPELRNSYIALRNRTARLMRLLEIAAPRIIIENECGLIRRALDEIDPMWNVRP